MSLKGYGINERYSQDPIGSNEPRGKSRERRKHREDGNTLTPTEQHIKNSCMKQFCSLEGSTNSEAYRAASCWDENGRLKP